jgi:acetylornithine/N-succinyldiaminopimelate aminotransferase
MMSEKLDEVMAREERLFAPGVRRWPVALVRGEGSRVWDVDGKEYIDLTAGWAVTAIGHCHPALAEAIADQARTLIQTTNIVFTLPQLELAEQLARLTPDGINRSFFVSSGSEANEGAIKLAHRATGRSRYVSMFGSFHGRTLGSLSLLGQERYRARWSSLLSEATFVPYGDLAAAEGAIGSDVAAVIVEPMQGEGGVVVPPDGYLEGLRRACDASGALLILDEIQTGIGRTGKWFALEHSSVAPDILTLGKGLGGGVPVACFLATDAVMSTIEPGDHGGTYAGNPLSCRAASTVIRVIEEEGLVERAARIGAGAAERLREFARRAPERVEEVRGRGLLLGLVLREPEVAARVLSATREAGVLVNLTSDRVFRVFPPLNIPEGDLARGLDVLERAVEKA